MRVYIALLLMIPALATAGGKYKPPHLTIDRRLNNYASAFGGDSYAKGGNARSDSSSLSASSSLSNSSAQSGDSNAESGDSSASSAGQSVNFSHSEKRRPVSTAAAVPIYLPSGGYNCGKGSGGSLQTGLFGFSLSGSGESDGCVILHMLDAVDRMGLEHGKLALKDSLLCQHPIYRQARAEMEVPCPGAVRGVNQAVGMSSGSR